MPNSTDFLPSRESDLVTWSTNFSTLITANPVIYGLDLGQAAAYAALHAAFIAAYQTANDPSTRTPSAIVSKNDAKDALIASARDLAGIAQNFPGITDVLRSDLGITVPDTEPTPILPPSDPPGMDIISAVGRTVRLRLHDFNSPASRGKPDGVAGAAVFSFVGDTAPVELDDWQFEGNTTRTSVDVEFAPEVPNGSTVWLTAFWFNPRAQSGPAAQPLSTNIPGGLAQAA
jgi:hypothetical protein